MSDATPAHGSPAHASTLQLVRQGEGMAELAVLGSDYRLHLVIDKPLDAQPGDRVTGIIRGNARRVDVVPSGGRFIEPSTGRPRRVQGRAVGGSVHAGTIHVNAGVVFVVRLTDPRQSVSDFSQGQLLAFDVERGATLDSVRVTAGGTRGASSPGIASTHEAPAANR